MSTPKAEEVARHLIAAAGGRQTRPRIAALIALMESGRVATHAEIHRRLPRVDRVSLYRALDWLVDHRLAHRLSDADGVHRYGPSPEGTEHGHPHFHCTRCGLTTCLDHAKTHPVRLPHGFRTAAIDVLVKGLCSTCTTS